MGVRQILKRLSNSSLLTTEKGEKFEEFARAYLMTDPAYADEIEKIWKWSEWPHKDGHDTGIDLIARTKDGQYWAIQAKFYEGNTRVNKGDVDTFLAASGKSYDGISFDQRIFFTSTDNWNKNATKALENQLIPVTRIGLAQLEESKIDWDKFNEDNYGKMVLKAKHELRDHQKEALDAAHKAFIDEGEVRGKLIMSCGTGKTFTSLEIARDLTNNNGTILFLAPSISLVAQSMREWISESRTTIYPIVICSDSTASKGANVEDLSTIDLIHPATTNAKTVERQYREIEGRDGLKVFFCTYQSIGVVQEFQKNSGVVFDLVICDEAHRTTGATALGEKQSYFLTVHDNEKIPAKKRIYMTATPRIYGEAAKAKANDKSAYVSSMDDPEIYGDEIYRIGFAESIKRGLLTDYKVQIIAVDEGFLDRKMRSLIDDAAEKGQEITMDALTKTYGIWAGLSKKSHDPNEYTNDPDPMRKAIIYTNRIKDSEALKDLFKEVAEKYGDDPDLGLVPIDIDHIDGKMNSLERSQKLDWLKGGDEETCRILTNARCLSEGVDVPSLDAVAFANPRSSLIDIIQSVGRAMRKDPSGKKKYGYIIIPVAIPAQSDPDTVLDESRYSIIWNVLRALRAHDERLNAKINQLAMDRKHGKKPKDPFAAGSGSGPSDNPEEDTGGPDVNVDFITDGGDPIQGFLDFGELEQWQDSIFAKLVLKLGDSKYWETWAKDVADIAQRFIMRIGNLLKEGDPEVTKTFNVFLKSLQADLNKSITEQDAKEMLAQHLITRPIFEALFKEYDFTRNNPVSKSLDAVIDVLSKHGFDAELAEMEGFYSSVRERVGDLKTTEARQQVIKDLYNNFFKLAFEKQAEKLGIVYTPIEIIDFILHSVEWLLNTEFDSSLADEGVEILDPFSGTGTFITRLLQSGIIPNDRLMDKYLHEIHANEIILLAYYIATINIEEVFHSLSGSDKYVPFEGMVLADTFQMAEERQQAFDGLTLEENSERIKDQKKRTIRVVASNPPYSAKQRSQNDNNENVNYPALNKSIESTYVKKSESNFKGALYDSYIKAFRWATDRLPKDGDGIVGFVTNGSFIDNAGMGGFRKSLVDEFTDVYVINLRGNQRTSGEVSRKEGGKIFGSGSRAPIAITFLIRNADKHNSGKVHYYDIGEYLSREEKLKIINDFKDGSAIKWQILTPDMNNDWINLRDKKYKSFIPIGNKKESERTIFLNQYSRGLATSRDPWCTNYSSEEVERNIKRLLESYSSEVERFINTESESEFKDFINYDPKKISWTANLIANGRKAKVIPFTPDHIYKGVYRPFCRQNIYFDSYLNERVYRLPNLFPSPEYRNKLIQVSGVGAAKDFSCIMLDTLPDLQIIANGQCFPLYWYGKESGPLAPGLDNYAISDWYLDKTRSTYHDDSIGKEDIFYYIYGILHSPEYRERFASDLKKELPRIPFVKDFWGFSKAGRKLADLHLNYEQVAPYPDLDIQQPNITTKEEAEQLYRVEKMKHPKKRNDEGKLQPKLDTIIYNPYITISGIPDKAYEYVVNGKPAIEWIIEQYQVKKDKASGIVNDPNDWSKEVNNPRYILDLLLSIINVSVQTVDLVNSLPPLEIISE